MISDTWVCRGKDEVGKALSSVKMGQPHGMRPWSSPTPAKEAGEQKEG